MPLELRSAKFDTEKGLFVMVGPSDPNISLHGQTQDHGRILGKTVLIQAQSEYRDINSLPVDDPDELQEVIDRIAGKGSDPEHPERYMPDADREARLIIPDMMEGLKLQFFELVPIDPPLHVPA